jgi:CNT family concentrative nucleoside transporter
VPVVCGTGEDADAPRSAEHSLMPHLGAAFGLFVLLAVAWALSRDRRRFPLRTVVGGLLLQIALGVLVLKTQAGIAVFDGIARLVLVVFDATMQGTEFVFGKLVNDRDTPWGFIFAIRALPAIIVFSSLSAIGYHLGVLQRVVLAMAWVMRRTLRVSGAESLSAAGNVFLGQTEAPLLVRPYIPKMTFSELNAVMVGGFATVQGSLIAVYAALLGIEDAGATNEFARHLLTASLISAPASLLVAKIVLPERDTPLTASGAKIEVDARYGNVIDAAATGASDGLKLAANVAAMLIAFLAIIALLDQGLAFISGLAWIQPLLQRAGVEELSLAKILGWLFYPVAWLIGAVPDDRADLGSLLGLAMAANEFVAYASLREMIAGKTVDPRTAELAVYALCGFANFSSIAIQMGGIGGMAPQRRSELAQLGLRAMFGGALACWMTACVAGMLT